MKLCNFDIVGTYTLTLLIISNKDLIIGKMCIVHIKGGRTVDRERF